LEPVLTWEQSGEETPMKKALLILSILGVIALIAWKMMEETE
jgi:hypothetical protein